MLQNEHGGFVFHNQGPGFYEIHTLFLPAGRGHRVREALDDAKLFMFTQTDCAEIVTRIPQSNRSALRLAQDGGFEHRFTREHGYEGAPTDYYALTLDQWICRTPSLEAVGEDFHAKLEAQIGHENHPHDPAHDRYVGAAVMMLNAGNPHKAIATYNRWATWAGYQPVTLVNFDPVRVDVGTAVMAFPSMEVVPCQ